MNYIIYYLFILPLSYLPYFLVYLLSDILSFIMYRIIGYRKKIITNNITNSFPEKNTNQIHKIVKQFYSHFCDLIIESFKGFSISKSEIIKRLQTNNQDLIDDFARNKQSVILIGGHYNNWEICGQCAPIHCMHELYAIYKPLKNKFFDKKMRDSREKFGLNMIPMKGTKKYFTNNTDIPRAIVFGSDQSPSNPKKAYWAKFLNQDTGFLYGAEKYAKEFNWPVIYVGMTKTKRGHYLVNYQLITDDPSKTKTGEIMEKFAELLEKDIEKDPSHWLWSHKRWKHKKP